MSPLLYDLMVIKPDFAGKKLFLMGLIKGAPDWQSNVIRKLESMEASYIIANPRTSSDDNFNLDNQIAWETHHLSTADIILCHIPEPDHEVKGRTYAQTTRFELGEYLALAAGRKQKILVCIDKSFPGRSYLEYKVKQEYSGAAEWFENLTGTGGALFRFKELSCISGETGERRRSPWES